MSRRYSGEGQNVSPPLNWSASSDRIREFAIMLEDIDAPGDRPWIHWMIWGIPGDTSSIEEGDGSPFRQGTNDSGGVGYMGPMPPPGNGTHYYYFTIYALDRHLNLENGADRDDLLGAMEGHILDRGELVTTYQRP